MDFLFPHGFKYPPDFHIPTPTGDELFRIGPVGYTNAHLTMAIVIVLLAGISFLATRNMRERPAGLQNAVELLAQGLADFVASIGGQNALKYLPLFGTLFLFIVTSNWPFVGLVVFLGLVQGLVFALLVLMYFILAIESHDEEHEEGSQADTDRVPSPEMHPRPAAST